jgi:hypothetical protein
MATNGPGFAKPEAAKALNKISAVFDKRRLLAGHMFFNADQSDWHFFYFDQRDYVDRNNHWEGGSHIHFINWLWPNRTAESVWEEFRSGKRQMRGALHIRFDRGKRRRSAKRDTNATQRAIHLWKQWLTADSDSVNLGSNPSSPAST